MEKKTRKKSKILPFILVGLIIVIILIVCIASSITKKQEEKKQEQINQAEQEAINRFNQPVNETTEKQNTTSNASNDTITYQGFEMIGSIEINKINLKYPILKESSQKALEKSVCLMYGSLNSNRNVVIGGITTMFSKLKDLSKDDEISIVDTKGSKTQYIVYDKFETSNTDTSFYDRDTKGKNEITLVTVADNGTDRLVIVAKEK